MTVVYELKHLEEKNPDGFQDYKTVGVYSTRKKAEKAIERYRDLPGFRDYPERWHIHEVTLDETDWANGFDKETHRRLP
jgi:hypothetical protein